MVEAEIFLGSGRPGDVEAGAEAGQEPGGVPERVAELRRLIAKVPGGAGVRESNRVYDAPPAPTPPAAGGEGAAAAVPAGEIRGVALPAELAELTAGGVLPAGRVVGVSGGLGLRVGLIAAASGGGTRCAVVGHPSLGLAAIAEQGGDLDRVALVPDPGADAAAVVSVLLDGFELVVVDPAVCTVAPSRARVLAGRVRSCGAVLVTGPAWPGVDLTLQSRTRAYAGLGSGVGRLESHLVAVRCADRSGPPHVARWTIGARRPAAPAPAGVPTPAAAGRAPLASVAPLPVERAG